MSSFPTSPLSKYVGSSLTLFLDQLLVAFSNGIFWLLISKITTISDIGNATSIYSLIMLTGTLTQLGLEYPLLKNTLNNKSHIFSTSLIIEIMLTACSIPFIIFAIGNLYSENLEQFIWLSVVMLFFYSTSFITRFVLLGMFSTKHVLMIDLVGAVVRFVVGYLLVFMGLSTFGIILAFLIQFIVMTAMAIAIALVKKDVGFKIGNRHQFKEILKPGLINAPAKFSRTLIIFLSVVLLASFGIDADEIGIFYMVLMITVIVGGLVPSMAYMLIPTSSESNRNFSSGSIRLALTLTAPVIAALISGPEYILSLLGSGYISGSDVLILLSICILPSSVVMLSISIFNTQGRFKELLIIGSLQVFIFIVLFNFLVPAYGILGCAISMLAAFIISSMFALSRFDRINIRYLLNSGVAILVGCVPAYVLGHFMHLNPLILIIISMLLSSFALIKLKNTSVEEINRLIKLAIKYRKFDKILVIGNYGNFNIGDEIILKEIIRQYSLNTDPNTPLFLIPTRNPFFVDIYHIDLKGRINAIPINHFFKILVTFLKCNRVLIGGGGIWSKYTGSYAHVIPLIAILARIIFKPVDFVCFGIYSTSSSIDKFLVNLAVLASNSCSVRDSESFSMLWKSCQRKTNIDQDLSLSYIKSFDKDSINNLPKVSEYENIMKHRIQGHFVVGISLKEVHSKDLTLKLIDEFSNALNALNSEFGNSILFVFFPFAKTNSKTENDTLVVNQILERVTVKDNIVQISHSNSLSWFVAIDKLVDIFIGMRYHSIIFSTLALKPLLCIPYENKIYQFLSDMKNLSSISVVEPTQIDSAILIKFIKTRLKDKNMQSFRE